MNKYTKYNTLIILLIILLAFNLDIIIKKKTEIDDNIIGNITKIQQFQATENLVNLSWINTTQPIKSFTDDWSGMNLHEIIIKVRSDPSLYRTTLLLLSLLIVFGYYYYIRRTESKAKKD